MLKQVFNEETVVNTFKFREFAIKILALRPTYKEYIGILVSISKRGACFHFHVLKYTKSAHFLVMLYCTNMFNPTKHVTYEIFIYSSANKITHINTLCP